MDNNRYIEKTYCLYASEWHLTIMLLPFISKKLSEKDKVYMKFENSIEDKIKALTNKLSFKNKEEINDIRWNMEVNDEDDLESEKVYVVAGSKEYMDEMNEKISNYYKNKDARVKIINCFNIIESKENGDIISDKEYSKVLTTNGENSIQSQ